MHLVRRSLSYLALLPALTVCAPAATAEPLHLEDAVRSALAHNERGAKAPLRVESAEATAARARGAFFPTLVFGTQLGVVPRTQVTGTLTLSQPLLNPSAFPLYDQAKHNLYSERWGAEQDRRLLGFDTAKAFLQTLAAERIRQAAERRLATARNNLEYAEARVQAGLTSSNDVTRAKVAMASALTSVAQAEGTVTRAYLTLSFLAARVITDGLSPSEALTKRAMSYDVKDDDIRAALDRRFDVKSAHERSEATRIFASEPLYRLIPQVSAVAGLRFDPAPLGNQKNVDANVGLSLTWAIFDAGFRYADRASRLAQAESVALDEKLLRRSVETDVKLALTSVKVAREAYRIAGEAIVSAQQNVAETASLYSQGLARGIEMTEANLTRFDAEVQRESARVSMEQAYLDLRLALGYGPLDD